MPINYLRDQGSSTIITGGGGTQLADQAGNSGKYLTTNGSTTSWAAITKINNLAGGAATQIPFQSATDTTAFSSTFTIDSARGTLSVYNGGTGTTATLILGSNTYGEHRITTGVDGANNNQSLRIQPHRQDLIGAGQRGGTVTISGGDVGGGSGLYGLAGGVTIIGGGAASTADGSGLYGANGPVTITGGPGSGSYPNGGSVTISGGTGNNSAGSVLINGGTGTNGGGAVILSTAPTSALVQRLKILATGAWSVGTGDTNYGSSRQVLTSNGNAAPTWSTQPYDLALTISGKPDASAVVLSFVAVRAFTLPSSFTGSRATTGLVATDAATFTISKNGASIGTLQFAAAASTGTFSGSAGSFAAGDVLTITAPSTQDTTLSNISLVLVANLV